jgi:mono/diheme cytochrome c family protein
LLFHSGGVHAAYCVPSQRSVSAWSGQLFRAAKRCKTGGCSIGGARAAADAQKKNPVKPTADGLAEAKKLYGYHCAMCHGKDGDGKGDLAAQMKLELNDWCNPSSISKLTDGELFCIITNGRGKMVGGEGDRTKEEVRWNLVNLVRSFGKKSDEPAKP